MSENRGETLYLYVGTYTEGDSEGIYVYRMHPTTGTLEFASIADAGGKSYFLGYPSPMSKSLRCQRNQRV